MAQSLLVAHLLLLVVTVPTAVGLNNGLGLHGPALGWSSWCAASHCVLYRLSARSTELYILAAAPLELVASAR
jgi:hypothetical protein